MKHYHIQDFVLFFFCLRSLQLLCQVGIIPANNAVLYEPVTPFSYLLFFSFGMFDASWISHRDRSGKAVRDSHLAELILNCCGMSCNNDALRGEISSKLAPPLVVETPSHRAAMERQPGMICIERIGMFRPAGWFGCGSSPTVLQSRRGGHYWAAKGGHF